MLLCLSGSRKKPARAIRAITSHTVGLTTFIKDKVASVTGFISDGISVSAMDTSSVAASSSVSSGIGTGFGDGATTG